MRSTKTLGFFWLDELDTVRMPGGLQEVYQVEEPVTPPGVKVASHPIAKRPTSREAKYFRTSGFWDQWFFGPVAGPKGSDFQVRS